MTASTNKPPAVFFPIEASATHCAANNHLEVNLQRNIAAEHCALIEWTNACDDYTNQPDVNREAVLRSVMSGRICLGFIPEVYAMDISSWPQEQWAFPVLEYYLSETFRKHAGRAIEIVCMDSPETIGNVVREIKTNRVFLKHMFAPKEQSRLSVCKADFDPDLYWNSFGKVLGHTVLVQEHVPMRYEYRVFVVDGKIVTGAGCIQTHTPRDNTELFNPAVEEIRDMSDTIQISDLVSRYQDFARAAAVEFAEENPGMRFYTLDLAIGENGEVLIVELNTLLNMGLYACDANRLFTEIIDAAKRYPKKTPTIIPEEILTKHPKLPLIVPGPG